MRVSPHQNSPPKEAQGRRMSGCCPVSTETAPTIKEAGLSCRQRCSAQGLGPILLTNRRGKVRETSGSTGIDGGATEEVGPRERSLSLHHSQALGML